MKLGNVLSANALQHPDREALVCGDRRLTYGALEDRANRIANALLARGQAFGDRVALYLPNSAELGELMAAVFKSGGLMVPISTRLTVPEVSFIFEDSQPVAIFFAPEYREQAHRAAANVKNPMMIAVGEAEGEELSLEGLVAEGSPNKPPSLPHDLDECLIGYTSGTTGRPKGAVATHLNLAAMHGWINGLEWGINGTDRILVTTPMAHRTGTGRLAQALVLGATLVILQKFDAVTAVDTIEREKVTMVGMVPTITRMLLPEIEKRPEALASVRKMIATGEAFPFDIKKRLLEALPNIELYYFFAQTEAGYISLLRPEYQLSKPNSVGQVVPWCELRICDSDLNEQPVGTPGEVVIRGGKRGGIMTMSRYFNRPDAEAEIFIEDGWVRTGDMAYIDEEGFLYFVDRVRDMIVTGGLNVYSKEVEIALCEHPAVEDAAVIGVPDETYGEAVTAYVELKPGVTLEPQELIDFTRATIASYKKPRHIRFMDELPRTGTGKVTKQVLRDLATKEFGGASGAAEAKAAAGKATV